MSRSDDFDRPEDSEPVDEFDPPGDFDDSDDFDKAIDEALALPVKAPKDRSATDPIQ